MRKYFVASIITGLTACCNTCFAQGNQIDKLVLEVRCHDTQYVVNKVKVGAPRPSFILCIRNSGPFAVDLDQDIFFGHAGDERINNITFELFYLAGVDTVNVLNKIDAERTHATRHKNTLNINPTAGYFFEFEYLSPLYFKKSGRYMIRFTLLKKYASKYMTKDVSTGWIHFDVKVEE